MKAKRIFEKLLKVGWLHYNRRQPGSALNMLTDEEREELKKLTSDDIKKRTYKCKRSNSMNQTTL